MGNERSRRWKKWEGERRMRYIVVKEIKINEENKRRNKREWKRDGSYALYALRRIGGEK